MKPFSAIVVYFVISLQLCYAQTIFSWREFNRTGVVNETGLLKSWPAEGPKLLWSNLELLNGYSSVSFGEKTIYITGIKDTSEVLFALDMNGKMLWQTVMGRVWKESFPESRSTPTVEGNMVYTCSGYGDIACIDGTNGNIIWSYKGSELNKGTYGIWGIAESLLIDGEKLFFTPGGPETMTIALNKKNGKIIWRSSSLNDKPGYVSPILINYAGMKCIINVSMGHVFAINAANGEILWSIVNEIPDEFIQNGWELIKCVTPLYNNGKIYVTSGYNNIAIMIGLDKDGKNANILWKDSVLDVHHGGAVLVDGYIYGANWLNNGDGNWCCIDWNTGKKMWEEHWKCKGSIISAEGMLYIYDEKKGSVGLLKANPEKFDLVSSFQVTLGKAGPFWAHPVIHNGVLYLRHHNALMAYDIKNK